MNAAPDQSKLRTVPAAEARALLKEQSTGNLSIAAFARSRGVQPWSLYNAKAVERRKKEGKSAEQFARVAVVDETKANVVPPATPIELRLPSGLSLRVGAGFDEITLRRLLGVLASC